jgi:hypothetical protein
MWVRLTPGDGDRLWSVAPALDLQPCPPETLPQICERFSSTLRTVRGADARFHKGGQPLNVQAVTKVRTRRRALATLYQLVDSHLSEGDEVHMAVFNVAAAEEAARFSQQLEARFHPVEMIQTECSPVMGAHGGPGMVGVVFYVD